MVARWAVLLACALLAVPTAVRPATPFAAATYLAGLTLIVASVWWGSRRCPDAARHGWTLIARDGLVSEVPVFGVCSEALVSGRRLRLRHDDGHVQECEVGW